MLLLFKSTNRVNYAIEAFTLLTQYHFLFSERQSHQLLWSRFVNVHGLPARNVPCDLYMEHLCKDAVNHLQSNKTTTALVQVGKVVEILEKVVAHFDDDNGIASRSGKHSVADYQKDVQKVSFTFCHGAILF